MKTLGFFAAGIMLGIIAMVALNFSDEDGVATPVGDIDEKFDAFRRNFDARLSALEEDFRRLDSTLQSANRSGPLGEPVAVTLTPEDLAAATEANHARLAQFRERLGVTTPESEIDSLMAAGFTQDRIAWAERRIEEIRVEVQQAQYDAQHGGESITPAMAARNLNPVMGLRDDMDDAEFERYLAALGRPISVGVTGVLASSPAETAGLLPGDEIVSYDGRRIFSNLELSALAAEIQPGRSVAVDIRRNGQPLQIIVPAGPLGISSDLARELLGGRIARPPPR